MKTALFIFTGSGIGGVSRYLIQKLFIDMGYINFPAGTFIVNILGCFLIGLFNALAEKYNVINPEWRLALTTGFCGGFTTFSTFANENMSLLRNGDYLYFSLYILLSVAIGIGAVVLGTNILSLGK
jgi:CrcB protein